MATTSCCRSSSSSQEDYQNIMSNIVAVEAMNHIDELISYIDQFLKEERKVGKVVAVDSSIKSAGVLLNKGLKRSNRHLCKSHFKRNLNRETRKLIIDVTNQAAQIKWLGVALSVVAFVLERIEQVSSNTKECIPLLKYMCELAKHIKQLDERLPQGKLNRVLQFIVEGSALCITHIKSDRFSRCLAAPVTAGDLLSLRGNLELEYADLSLVAINAVANRTEEIANRTEEIVNRTEEISSNIPVVLPPSQGIPPQAVGTEGPRMRVTQLLDMTSRSVRVVVIYGQGGIGKTTLATAVFNKLDLQNYKFCRVDMQQDCSETDLKLLQQQILRDLFRHNVDLRSLNEGREELSKKFKEPSSRPLFIFIDNALKGSDFEKLLPINDLASLPAQSRILVTTRNLNEISRMILQAGIERCYYQVPILPPEEAQKLLSEFALGSRKANFDPTIDIGHLLEICQGVPLVLKLAGARLREQAQNVPACREAVEYLKTLLVAGEEGELSERMVDFVYKRLEASCKEAFLDTVFFFCNWERCRVAYSVGETELQELERAALVNITDEGRVNVHDIVQARGRKLSSDGDRIIDQQSLTDVLQNEERIKKTKGIALPENFELEARHLNLMNRCLRVLITPEDTRIVNGECKGAFENLRLLRLNNHNYSLMELSKHPRLAVFILEFDSSLATFFNLSGLASSLKYLALRSATLAELSTPFSQLQSLRFLKLWDCRGFDSLPETIVNLSALEKLDIVDMESVSLPDSFGQLRSLRYLTLGCISALPESFGNLATLELLSLEFCTELSNLPQNFGQLNRLKYLNIYCCEGLQSLSGDFECLSSLIAIKASRCSRLEGNTMDKLGKMKGLLIVDIEESPLLQERWEQVKGQYSLAVVLYRFRFLRIPGVYPHADVVCRAFFHSESKFLHVDENGQFGESSCPVRGVKLSLLLTMCDLSAAANRRYLKAVRKRWEEVGGGEMMMMVFVDMGGSCREESERRVRGILPYLPRGSTAWIAPDNRARLLFAHSLFKANSLPEYEPTVIVSISTSMDEEGKRNMMFHDFIIPDYKSDFEYARIFDQLFSPILQAHAFLQFDDTWDNFREFKTL